MKLGSSGGEIGGKGGVDFVSTGECAVDDADAIDLCFDTLDTIGFAIDVLFKNITDPFAIDVEAGKKFLTAAKGCTVVNSDTTYHDVNALVVKRLEADANALDELMTGNLEVMLVVGIVDNSLDVAFVVTRLQFELVGIIFHFLIK